MNLFINQMWGKNINSQSKTSSNNYKCQRRENETKKTKQQQTQQTVPKQLLLCRGRLCRLRLRLRVSTTARPQRRHSRTQMEKWKWKKQQTKRQLMNACMRMCVCGWDMRTFSCLLLFSCLALSKCLACRTAEQSKQSQQAHARAFAGLACFCRRAFQTFYQSVKNIWQARTRNAI